jgi:hypothetical protein
MVPLLCPAGSRTRPERSCSSDMQQMHLSTTWRLSIWRGRNYFSAVVGDIQQGRCESKSEILLFDVPRDRRWGWPIHSRREEPASPTGSLESPKP